MTKSELRNRLRHEPLHNIVALTWGQEWATKLKRAILGDIVDTITEETPAADVEPVKRGEWLTDENRDRTWCSVCNVNCGVNYDQAIEEMNYCPNCGAKMKG